MGNLDHRLQTFAEPVWRKQEGPHLGHGHHSPHFRKPAGFNVDLRVTLQNIRVFVQPFDRRIVQNQLVKRAVPDDDRAIG